jgi:hypothetical protein
MSRFWGGDESGSNSDSESDSDRSSKDEKKADNKRVWDIESSDDSDDDVR